MKNTSFRKSDFFYDLPDYLIAQDSLEKRDNSKLLVLNRNKDAIQHRRFHEIMNFMIQGDILVVNDVKVVPAKILGHRLTGGKIELLFLDGWDGNEGQVLLKPARRIQIGESLDLQDGSKLKIIDRNDKVFSVRLESDLNLLQYLSRYGEVPLPPYIHRKQSDRRLETDKMRYQTVFAENSGAIAAPTAGLHFTRELVQQIKMLGIDIVYVTLWVGWGTFKPVTVDFICDHKMESELYSIPEKTAQKIKKAKQENRRIIAVGTTSVRALESWCNDYPDLRSVNKVSTNMFIYPGYNFKMVDVLVTNFHLPSSTLLMLVSAFAGREQILETYKSAVEMNYRFFSYGDSMMII